ncbi:hypothetical protein ABZ920_05300 [Streptomyces sp. NPDC046831]|uniref:hypothetical protein n=1 Tax=Streptomyces sp. NPDC046831 TaxID=3154805 RepID=UPI0033D9A12D
MAKNRKQDRSRQKAPVSAQGAQEPQPSAREPRTEHHVPQMSPSDVGRKGRQKRFGHN